MKDREIYLCRHGETAWSLSGRHTGRTDIPLTEKGEREANLLGDRLQKIRWSEVLTSPLKRASETCRLAGIAAKTDSDAVEWDYGKYEGLTREEVHRKNPSWNLFENGAPDGESLAQITARADRLLQKLRSHTGPIALFSHGHFLRVFAARYLGLPAEQGRLLFLSVASLSILSAEHSQPVIKLWNDTSHLQ